MTTFWIIAAVMLLTALVIVAPALLRRRSIIPLDRNRQNVVIAQERLGELETDLANGVLTPEQFEQTKRELEQSLLLDLDDEAQSMPAEASRGPGRAVLAVLALALPVITVSLYLTLGSPQMISPRPTVAAPHQSGGGVPSIEQMLQVLNQRLQANPEDVEGWFLLGRTHMALNNYPEAISAFERTRDLVGDEPAVLLSLADALTMSAGGDMSGKPGELIDKAVALAPTNTTALWLAGMREEQRGDYAKSLGYFRTLQPMLQDDAESSRQVAMLISQVRDKAGDAADVVTPQQEKAAAAVGATVSLRVRLADELAGEVNPEESLFVYARALEGPKMPLAAARMQVKDLPLEITLDDSSAMMPQLRLSNFPQVTVGARVSRSGNAIAASGDLRGEVTPVAVGGGGIIEVVIDQRIP